MVDYTYTYGIVSLQFEVLPLEASREAQTERSSYRTWNAAPIPSLGRLPTSLRLGGGWLLTTQGGRK